MYILKKKHVSENKLNKVSLNIWKINNSSLEKKKEIDNLSWIDSHLSARKWLKMHFTVSRPLEQNTSCFTFGAISNINYYYY